MSLLRKSFPTTACCLKVNTECWFIVVVQSPIHVQLFVTPWTAAHQAFLSLTVERWCESLTMSMVRRVDSSGKMTHWVAELWAVWIWQDEGHKRLREHWEHSSQWLQLCPCGSLEHLLASVYYIMLTNAFAMRVVFLRFSILRERNVSYTLEWFLQIL